MGSRRTGGRSLFGLRLEMSEVVGVGEGKVWCGWAYVPIGDKAVGEVEGHLWSEDGVSMRDEGTSSSMTSRRAQR